MNPSDIFFWYFSIGYVPIEGKYSTFKSCPNSLNIFIAKFWSTLLSIAKIDEPAPPEPIAIILPISPLGIANSKLKSLTIDSGEWGLKQNKLFK